MGLFGGNFGGNGIFTSDNAGLSIENLDIGFSEEGLKTYRATLRTELIDRTEEALKNVSDIQAAVDAGWQGEARDKFLSEFDGTITKIIEDLKNEYEDLESRFAEIERNYITQDQELMNN